MRRNKIYAASDVAVYVIMRCNTQKKPINNLQLQKILYFIQAISLVVRDVPFFKEEIEAWDFGPVIPEVYNQYKLFGSGVIPLYFHDKQRIVVSTDKDMINKMIDACAAMSETELLEAAQRQSPWREAFRNFDNIISVESMRNFFCWKAD